MLVGVSRRGKSKKNSEGSRSWAFENARFFVKADSDLTRLKTASGCENRNKLP
jgi:hypothetical protein